jgi:hypothetical protein
MASRSELPADVAAAFDRVPEARDRFAAMPAERQIEWLKWIDRGRGRRGRAARIDEAIRRLIPSATAAEEEVAEPVGPPPERYWWLWLLLLLLLVIGGLLAWWLLTRGDDKSTVPNVIGLRSGVATARIHDHDLDVLPRTGQSNRPRDVVFAQKPGAGTQLDEGQTVTISISSGRLAVPDVVDLPLKDAQQELTTKGFDNEVKRVASSRPKGIVVEQAPVGGVTAVRDERRAERLQRRQAGDRAAGGWTDAGSRRDDAESAGPQARLAKRGVGEARGNRRRAETAGRQGGRQGLEGHAERLDRDGTGDHNGRDDRHHGDDGHRHDHDDRFACPCSTRRRPGPDTGASAPQHLAVASDRHVCALEPAREQSHLPSPGGRHLAAA